MFRYNLSLDSQMLKWENFVCLAQARYSYQKLDSQTEIILEYSYFCQYYSPGYSYSTEILQVGSFFMEGGRDLADTKEIGLNEHLPLH